MTFIQNLGSSSFFSGGSAIGQKSLAEQPLVSIPQSQNTAASGYDFNYGMQQPQNNNFASMLMASLVQAMLGSWLGPTIGNALPQGLLAWSQFQPQQNALAQEDPAVNIGNLQSAQAQEPFQALQDAIQVLSSQLEALQNPGGESAGYIDYAQQPTEAETTDVLTNKLLDEQQAAIQEKEAEPTPAPEQKPKEVARQQLERVRAARAELASNSGELMKKKINISTAEGQMTFASIEGLKLQDAELAALETKLAKEAE